MKAFYANNVTATATTITPYSENPTYPCSTALKDSRLSRYYRSIGVSSENIVFDFGAATSCTDIIILGHNFTAGATITIQANATNVWTSPSYSQVLTVADDIAYTFAAAQNYRYWRLTIADASNPDTYIQIAYVFIGNSIAFPAMSPDQKVPRYSSADFDYSVSGQLYGSKKIQWRGASVTFSMITDTQKKAIETMFGVVDKVSPFVLMIWEDSLDVEPLIYCHFTKDLEWSKSGTEGLTWILEMTFREVF